MKDTLFSCFHDKRLCAFSPPYLGNDIYLIHQGFYLFLAMFAEKFDSPQHREILRDELGLTKRGQTKNYGQLPHSDLWLKDLGINDISSLSLLSNEYIIPFQRACYEAAADYEKGQAFLAAVESVAFDFVSSIGRALKNSGFKKLLSVEIHCNPKNGLEVLHEQETKQFQENPDFKNYRNIVVKTFQDLSRHFWLI